MERPEKVVMPVQKKPLTYRFLLFVTRSPKGGCCNPLPGIVCTEQLIHLYLLPVYRYGPLLSIDTKMSTIKLQKRHCDVINSARPRKYGCIENIQEN